MSKLSTVARFYVLRMTPPAGGAVVVTRKKGYVSFLNEENADLMAARLSESNPGSRFYVAAATSGHLVPTAIAPQHATY